MSNRKLEFKTIGVEKIGGKQIKCIQVRRLDGRDMTHDQVVNFFNDLKARGIDENKMSIRGLNYVRFTTLKTKQQSDIDFDDDYYQNKVLDREKFDRYKQLQIYIYS